MTRVPDTSFVTASYVEFYRTALPRLIALLRYNGAELHEAADMAQEALMAALPPKWETLSDPYAWCRVVALRNFRRLAQRHRHESLADDLEAFDNRVAYWSSFQKLAEVEAGDEILSLLRRLPARQREIMALTYDGSTPAEIAETLGVSPAAVRASLMKARSALKAALAERRAERPALEDEDDSDGKAVHLTGWQRYSA
jgi:RNA polymerase sigma factor (sigma-70 family)